MCIKLYIFRIQAACTFFFQVRFSVLSIDQSNTRIYCCYLKAVVSTKKIFCCRRACLLLLAIRAVGKAHRFSLIFQFKCSFFLMKITMLSYFFWNLAFQKLHLFRPKPFPVLGATVFVTCRLRSYCLYSAKASRCNISGTTCCFWNSRWVWQFDCLPNKVWKNTYNAHKTAFSYRRPSVETDAKRLATFTVWCWFFDILLKLCLKCQNLFFFLIKPSPMNIIFLYVK